MSGKLQDRIAIITGAGVGFGRQIAVILAGAGRTWYWRRGGVPAGGNARWLLEWCHKSDAGRRADAVGSLDTSAGAAHPQHGTIDILVNNANIAGYQTPVHDR
jgi:NAD(P)-dependent dehydrogenase (short-subunit alcohol dehydrogenase family)